MSGATGVRIMATMLHEMERRNSQFALETMCIGGGQGATAVIEHMLPNGRVPGWWKHGIG